MANHSLDVKIDPDRCVSYGKCAAVGAGVFMIDEDTTKAYFDEEALLEAKPQTIFAAARACPTQAIQIFQYGRRIYPQILAPMPGEIKRENRFATEGESD